MRAINNKLMNKRVKMWNHRNQRINKCNFVYFTYVKKRLCFYIHLSKSPQIY